MQIIVGVAIGVASVWLGWSDTQALIVGAATFICMAIGRETA
jgi:hypothetical protein